MRSPAKLNLALQVLKRRSDGFHEIRSVAIGIDLCDELSFTPIEGGFITLTCDDDDLPTDDDNLIVRAARSLQETTSTSLGATILLQKNIPVSAGLGGGSGNAAATLHALNELWKTGLSTEALAELGAEIGSDVPLFFSLPSVRMTGRGECVEPACMAWTGWAFLVLAGCAVSTAEVYAACRPRESEHDPSADILRSTTADELAAHCVNELESAVFQVAPAVGELFDIVRAVAPRPPRVSGAGQSVYVLCDHRDEADALRAEFAARNIGSEALVVQSWTGPLDN